MPLSQEAKDEIIEAIKKKFSKMPQEQQTIGGIVSVIVDNWEVLKDRAKVQAYISSDNTLLRKAHALKIKEALENDAELKSEFDALN